MPDLFWHFTEKTSMKFKPLIQTVEMSPVDLKTLARTGFYADKGARGTSTSSTVPQSEQVVINKNIFFIFSSGIGIFLGYPIYDYAGTLAAVAFQM